MEASSWIGDWFHVIETAGVIGSLLLAAYTTRKDERARRVSNSIAINEQYRKIWKEVYSRPELERVLDEKADVTFQSVSLHEQLFVNILIQHLGTVYRAMKEGEFVKLLGLQKDVNEFFSLPIPKAVWEKSKPFQDSDFVAFIDTALKH